MASKRTSFPITIYVDGKEAGEVEIEFKDVIEQSNVAIQGLREAIFSAVEEWQLTFGEIFNAGQQ